jgi:hypothetical protein
MKPSMVIWPNDSFDFWLSLLIDSEDGSDIFLLNFGLLPRYAALQSRRA